VGTLGALLEEYTGLLRASGSPTLDRMRPGHSPEHVRERLRAAGVPPAGELVDWFSWCDGETGLKHREWGDFELAPTSLAPVSLEASLDRHRVEQRTDAEYTVSEFLEPPQTDPDYWWPLSWVVIARVEHTLLVADAAAPDGVHCVVRNVSLLDPILVGTSIEAVVRYWVLALRAGCARWDPGLDRWVSEPSGSPRWPAPLEPGILSERTGTPPS